MHASRCIHHTAARTAFASTNTVFHYIWGRGVLSGVLVGLTGLQTPVLSGTRPQTRKNVQTTGFIIYLSGESGHQRRLLVCPY